MTEQTGNKFEYNCLTCIWYSELFNTCDTTPIESYKKGETCCMHKNKNK